VGPFLAAINPAFTATDLENVFTLVDQDGSGTVDSAEFVQLMVFFRAAMEQGLIEMEVAAHFVPGAGKSFGTAAATEAEKAGASTNVGKEEVKDDDDDIAVVKNAGKSSQVGPSPSLQAQEGRLGRVGSGLLRRLKLLEAQELALAAEESSWHAAAASEAEAQALRRAAAGMMAGTEVAQSAQAAASDGCGAAEAREVAVEARSQGERKAEASRPAATRLAPASAPASAPALASSSAPALASASAPALASGQVAGDDARE
jgi:hypothetical protein